MMAALQISRARIVPSEQLIFLAFDFGEQRTGVAVGNRLTRSSEPLKTIHISSAQARFDAVHSYLKEWQPQALVVGIPFHPDGAPHHMTERAKRFARQLHGRFALPVHEVDERYSSVEAASRGAKDLDAAAACIILEQFFSEMSV
jgi:putative holliday junction resolvase